MLDCPIPSHAFLIVIVWDSSFGRGANATAVISLVRLAIGSSRCGRRAHTTRPVFASITMPPRTWTPFTLAAAACDSSRGGSAAFSWRAALGCPCPPSDANGSVTGGTTAPSVSVLAGPAWAVCPLAWYSTTPAAATAPSSTATISSRSSVRRKRDR